MSEVLYRALLYIEILVGTYVQLGTYCIAVQQKYKAKKMSVSHKNVQTKLTKGLLDLIILQLLDTHPMHGYELIVTIRKSYGVSFGASTIYPTLSSMEKKHYIKCNWNMTGERPKKVYTLTGEGKSLLNYTADSLRGICRIIGTNNGLTNDDHLQFNMAQSSKNKQDFAFRTESQV
jgi:PadR family transcriptional regulator PadR